MKRAFIDTNVIVCFLTGDPSQMADQARLLFDSVDRGEQTLVVPVIVIAETVWVLQSFFGYQPSDIARILQELLSHESIETDDKVSMLTALSRYAEKNIDFVDAILAVQMAQQTIREIYSFDHHFERLSGITRLIPGE